jgi:hypothetical protein
MPDGMGDRCPKARTAPGAKHRPGGRSSSCDTATPPPTRCGCDRSTRCRTPCRSSSPASWGDTRNSPHPHAHVRRAAGDTDRRGWLRQDLARRPGRRGPGRALAGRACGGSSSVRSPIRRWSPSWSPRGSACWSSPFAVRCGPWPCSCRTIACWCAWTTASRCSRHAKEST